MVVKKATKRRQVKKTTKCKKAVKSGQVKQAAKHEQAKKARLAAKRQQVKRRQASTAKRSSYSVEQKKKVVAYAKTNGRNQAARHFQLNASMVGRWTKASKKWTTETKRYALKVGSGRKAFFPEAEKNLYTWIIEQRKQGLAVTYITAKITMFDILKEPEMIALYGNSTEDFKASFRWLTSFMKRYKLSLRRRTKISQKLPEQTKESLERFQQFVTRLRIEKSFEYRYIFNMDETPVWFDMSGNFTINAMGEKTVHIRGTGNEKNRFTVVLTCAASKFRFSSLIYLRINEFFKVLGFITDGEKLPPICIFKGRKIPRGEQVPDGVVVWFQEKGWMNSSMMKDYVDYLVGEIDESELPKMMVYDSFKGHLEESVKEKFRESGFDLAVIPGGLTSICQPLDVAINKPFKDNLRKEWHLWMASGGAGETAAGNLRRARISEVCGWVKRAWDNISDEIIIQSFKKCGISNSLNELENSDIDEIEENEEFVIETHENLIHESRLQAR
jgi:DDE superfamily endonuclease